MPTFYIQGRARIRSREYSRTFVLSSEEVGLPRKCWTTEQWKLLETSSTNKALLTSDIRCYVMVLHLLIGDKEAKLLLSRTNDRVGRKEIIRLFNIAESRLLGATESPQVRTRTSALFRKIVTDYASRQALKEQISRTSLFFRTKLTNHPHPRELISDISNTLASPEIRGPIAALSHSNIQELIAKTEERLGFDLDIIRQACIQELKACAAVRAKLLELGHQKYSEQDKLFGKIILSSGASIPNLIKEFQTGSDPEFMLGLYQNMISIHRLAYLNRPFPPNFWMARSYLNSVLLDDQQHIAPNRFRVLYLPHRVISNELVAAFVLLLTYTGWNGMSLLNMTTDQIVIEGLSATIQGYKSKTDDYTPKVFLDSTHPYAIKALELMLWNRRQLIEFGFIHESEQRIWFSWTSAYEPYKHQYIGFQNALEKLQNQYKLPTFSLDQIRTQILAHQSLRTRDPEFVRRIAGHKSLHTTGHYLDQLILYRLNQAINLEFQRRLENTVIFRLSAKDENFGPLVKDRYVDLKLLAPLGDGASCTNPWMPPNESYMSGNLCDGSRCHIGDGCENRRIVLNMDRIRELIRKRLYYLRNWQRLEANNRHSFVKYHIPAILFTLGLYDYVKSSSHRHIVDAVEREINDNEAKL